MVASALVGFAATSATVAVANTGTSHTVVNASVITSHSLGAGGSISTYAGSTGNGLATSIGLSPTGVAMDSSGNIYVSDDTANSNVIRKISPSGSETVIAGNGTSGAAVSGINALQAQLYNPNGIAVDKSGNVYFADTSNNDIRMVDVTAGTYFGVAATPGNIYTIGGTGSYGSGGNGGPAAQAQFTLPSNVVLDPKGNLVVADTNNNMIRVIAASSGTFYGQQMTAGDVYSVAGTGISGTSTNGTPAIQAEVNFPSAVAVDSNSNLYIGDIYDCIIRFVPSTTGTYFGQAMTANDIYTLAGDGTCNLTTNGTNAIGAQLGAPIALALDPAGDVLFADNQFCSIELIAASSRTAYGMSLTADSAYRIAGGTVNGTGSCQSSGSGIPASSAFLNGPSGIAVDASGNIYVADLLNNYVRMIPAAGGSYFGQSMTANDIYNVVGNGTIHYSGDGGPAVSAQLTAQGQIATDASGNLYIPDSNARRVRMIPSVSGTYFGQSMTAGNIYTIFGNSSSSAASGDGGLMSAGSIGQIASLAVDSKGNVYFADTGAEKVRMLVNTAGTYFGRQLSAGYVYGIAGDGLFSNSGDGGPATLAGVMLPSQIALDANGDIFEMGTTESNVRMIANTSGTYYGKSMTAGYIYTVAGGTSSGYTGDGGAATQATLDVPEGAAVDSAGDLIIADSGNNVIRVVAATTGIHFGISMTVGDIYTIAGTSTGTALGDGGPATSATFNLPTAMAVTPKGNLLVADSSNERVREIATVTGSDYGISETAGDIYTVAGNGTVGYSGDGGPGPSAQLVAPSGLAIDNQGNLMIADIGTIREVSNAPASSGPTVTGLSVRTATDNGGGVVAITGTGFTGATAVSFGTGASFFSVSSSTLIDALIPPGNGAETVDVTVTTPSGVSPISAADQFTYTIPPPIPTVTSLSPSSGPAAGGGVIQVIGTNFTGTTGVQFGSSPTFFSVSSATLMYVIVPAGTLGTSVDVVVTTANGTSAVSSADKYSYVAPIPVPTVTSLSQASGPAAGGGVIEVFGTNFTGTQAVDFGTSPTFFSVASSTALYVIVPSGAVGTAVNVTVTTNYGTSALSGGDRYTFTSNLGPPTVSAVSPNAGPAAGGGVIQLTGTNFTGASSVEFGKLGSFYSVASATSIYVIVPPGTSGTTVDITVVTASGTSTVNSGDKYTYN